MVDFIGPGSLRTELALEDVTLTQDGAGGHVETWAEVATVFARLEPVRADARFAGDQTLESVTHRVTLRFRDTVKSGMRFRWGERVFAIQTVHDPDETRRYLLCRTREQGR
ncbi:phage head closure protein [Tianweitania sp. BSSL-BM11]|uniref:Phage head closure protein n=1 Tax=Tianweitania aestuarii TaxID=2814886 RepID=A0ABS5RS46_9HYPH|nr:phage head closure protein [Tianweitania aestuarii]MBS9719886.1 phage head closure protein [Tianweitania aestuarii]